MGRRQTRRGGRLALCPCRLGHPPPGPVGSSPGGATGPRPGSRPPPQTPRASGRRSKSLPLRRRLRYYPPGGAPGEERWDRDPVSAVAARGEDRTRRDAALPEPRARRELRRLRSHARGDHHARRDRPPRDVRCAPRRHRLQAGARAQVGPREGALRRRPGGGPAPGLRHEGAVGRGRVTATGVRRRPRLPPSGLRLAGVRLLRALAT